MSPSDVSGFGGDGVRRAIRLGKTNRKQADAVRVRVEQLVAASIVGHPPDDEVSRWLSGLDDVLHAKLAKVGLVEPRESSQLGAWLDKYIASRQDLKPESQRKLGQTITKLKNFFTVATPYVKSHRIRPRTGDNGWLIKGLARHQSKLTAVMPRRSLWQLNKGD